MINYDPNGLKPTEYEHPLDKAALEVLRKVPFVDKLVGAAVDFSIKSSSYLETVGNCCRVTKETAPHIYDIYEIALKRLNMHVEPQLFIKLEYDYNAFTSGINDTFIVINSSCIQDVDDDELLYILGHELGHIKSGHLKYHMLAQLLKSGLEGVFKVYSHLVTSSLMFALYDWQRKSELTADRAGMIAAGGSEALYSFCQRIMGRSDCGKYIDFSLESILDQYDDFSTINGNVVGKLIYIMQTVMIDHPWTIERIKKADEWSKTEQYEKLISAAESV